MQGEIFEKEEEKITNYHKKSKCREKVEKREPNSLCVLFKKMNLLSFLNPFTQKSDKAIDKKVLFIVRFLQPESCW